MRRSFLCLSTVLSGLLLGARHGAPESELSPAEDAPGPVAAEAHSGSGASVITPQSVTTWQYVTTIQCHRLERTSITRRDCDAIHEALANAALYSLPEKPLTGTDGLVLAVDARRGKTGLHSFTAWAPGPPHTAVLRALCEPVLVRFRAHPWITSAVTQSADELV